MIYVRPMHWQNLKFTKILTNLENKTNMHSYPPKYRYTFDCLVCFIMCNIIVWAASYYLIKTLWIQGYTLHFASLSKASCFQCVATMYLPVKTFTFPRERRSRAVAIELLINVKSIISYGLVKQVNLASSFTKTRLSIL